MGLCLSMVIYVVINMCYVHPYITTQGATTGDNEFISQGILDPIEFPANAFSEDGFVYVTIVCCFGWDSSLVFRSHITNH